MRSVAQRSWAKPRCVALSEIGVWWRAVVLATMTLALTSFATRADAGTVSVGEQAAQARFSAPVLRYTPGTFGNGLVAADFDDDGKIDLAAINCCIVGSVAVLAGNRDGSFGAPTVYRATSFVADIAAGDVTAMPDPIWLSWVMAEGPPT